MRAFELLILLLITRCAVGGPSAETTIVATNEVLTAAHYDVAEAIFKEFISHESKVVVHLGFGSKDSPLPPDLLKRFQGRHQIVRTGYDQIIVASNKFVLDKATRKEAVCFAILELLLDGDSAGAEFRSFMSSTAGSTRIRLIKERGKWKIAGKKMERVSDGF